MLLRWLALVALLFSASWLLTRLLKWVLLGAAGNDPAVVLTMTALLVVVQLPGWYRSGDPVHGGTGLQGVGAVFAAPAGGHPAGIADRRGDGAHPPRGDIPPGTGWVLLAIFVVLTIYAGYDLLDAVHLHDATAITAHRGSSITTPENTMAAILQAIEEGANFVEIDVQETKDGTVVLAHDKDLNRVFGINRRIWEVTYDELKDLDSGGWFSPNSATSASPPSRRSSRL